MSILWKNELDPWFEVMGLLSLHYTQNRQEIFVKELDNFGIDGEAFFARHFKLVEKYLKAFEKYKTSHPTEASYFEGTSDELLLLSVLMVIEHRDYLHKSQPWDVLALRSLIAFYLMDDNDETLTPDEHEPIDLPDEKSIIEFLETLKVQNEDKWRLLEIMRRPDVWLKQLLEIVNSNIPACEKAIAEAGKPLERLLKHNADCENPHFLKLAETCSSHAVIYYSLAMPLIQLITYTHCYQGLYTEYLNTLHSPADSARERIIRQMKSLSDKSKLDIMHHLKSSSLYNLELAEKLGLSPSTMSHHMSYLLVCGFVTVEKKNGKVYYCLEREAVKQFLNDLEKILL